jgi:hypothetical protein
MFYGSFGPLHVTKDISTQTCPLAEENLPQGIFRCYFSAIGMTLKELTRSITQVLAVA